MQLLHRSGLRRLVTRRARVRKVRAGLEAVRGTSGVFHLWTHPFNLADDRRFHFEVLEDILRVVTREREAGHLGVDSTGALAARLSGDKHQSSVSDAATVA